MIETNDGFNQQKSSDAWTRHRLILLGAVVAIGMLISACSSGADDTAATQATQVPSTGLDPGDGTIDIATWETYHEDPWIEQAEKDLGLTINVTRMGSVDELYATTVADPERFDLVLVDSGSIDRYAGVGLIAPVDVTVFENLGNINSALDYEKANVREGEIWAIPYNWGVQPLVFDTSNVSDEARKTWNTLWDSQYEGAVMIPDDAYITLPMVALAAGIDPFDWSDEDYAVITEKLSALRGQIRTLTKSFNEQETMMKSGEAVVGYAQAYQYASGDSQLGLSFPDEGVPFWLDNYFFTPKGANDAQVYKFVDYTLSKEWQCRFANETFQNGILSKEDAEVCFDPGVFAGDGGNLVAVLTPEVGKTLIPLEAKDLERKLELWNSFKAGTGG